MWKWGTVLLLVVWAGTFLMLGGCSDDGDPVLTDHEGYPLYKKHCRKCHGNQGGGKKASRMAKRDLDLGAPAFRDSTSLESVTEIVREGHGRMKGYEKKLTPEELRLVAAYVRALPTAAPSPD